MRILISITPLMYREVLGLSIHRCRPDFEVLLAPPGPLDRRAERFRPHVLVQDADEDGLLFGVSDSVLCRIRLLVTGRMDAKIELDGTASKIHDVRFGDLFGVLERVEELSDQSLGHSPHVG